MNYKFVIGGSSADFYLASYDDIMNNPDIVYRKKAIETSNPMLRFLYERHFNEKINNVIKLPFKSLWNPLILSHNFDKSDRICFLLFSNYTRYIDTGLFEYLRRKHPNCKIVMFFQDLAEKNKYKYPEKLKEYFDLILSFDQQDCEKYGWLYYPLVYSDIEVEDDPDIGESDIYFVGKAKDRFDEIIACFEQCNKAGLKTDFHIVGVPEDRQLYKTKINYCSQMPYSENLKRIKKTKCMLEVMQQGGHGYTLRYCEAITFGKRLITDNSEVKQAPFYKPELVSVFSKTSEFDVEFVLKSPMTVDYQFAHELSPYKLLEYIDSNLS